MVDSELEILLQSAANGNAKAREQLFAALYSELRKVASRELRRNSGATLSPTTLLHEAYINITPRASTAFAGRASFMAYAARAMRGLIIDHLRRRNAQKRGGEFEITTLPTEVGQQDVHGEREITRLHDALAELATVDERLAQCVDLKFFCGFSFGDIASMWRVSERTVQRDWDKARVLLNRLMNDAAPVAS
jgi:RNA polymerase sigma factor (TIGR02999 family)